MKRFVVILFMLVFGSLTANAQTSNNDLAHSGSVYSRIGVGEPVDFGSSAADGMGLTGVSFDEPFTPGLANPAQWGGTVYGMASGGIGLTNYRSADNESSTRNSLFTADHLQFQLPLIREKLGISASVTPYTRSSYRSVQINSKIIGTGAASDTLFYQTENDGSGGINMLELGAGWQINRYLSIGYAGSLVFASINNSYSTIFNSNQYSQVSFDRKISGSGFGNRVGLLAKVPNVFGKNDHMSIGASLMLPVALHAKYSEETNKQLQSGSETIIIDDSGPFGKGDIQLPMTINGGVTYQPQRTLSLSAEGLYQDWSRFRTDFNVGQSQYLADRYNFGLGLRYFPYLSGVNTFLSHFKYRVGASYDTGHLKIKGQKIQTLMFSLGLGILSPNSNASIADNSSIDISFEYGFRGTKAQNLVKENIWGLRLSLNLSELMFFRPKLK